MVPTCFQYILCCGASAIYNNIGTCFAPTLHALKTSSKMKKKKKKKGSIPQNVLIESDVF